MPTLERLREYFTATTHTWSVTVVSDGSTDQTVPKVTDFAAQDARFKLISYPQNRGKGCAVRTGMLHVEGQLLLLCDADLAAPIEEVEKLLPPIESGADIAIGSRPLKESRLEIRQPWYREMLGRAFNMAVQLLAIRGIKDTQCGFKLFRREVARDVFSRCKLDGFGYDFEALIPDERYKVLTKSVDYLVHVNLLDLEAERIGCEIKKLEIDLEVKRQVSEMKKQVQDRYGGAVPWEEWLKSQNLTQERLEAYLGSRARIILLKRLIVNYFETSTESYDLAHILCKTQATAQDVWVRLQRGANWDDLAVKESQDIGSANLGGKLPRHYKGDGLAAEVADAAYALKDGEYSKPVKSAYGWHIVKRNKTNLANTAKFFDRRPEFLAFPDVDDDRFGRWVRVVMSRGVYTMEFRVPGVHCEPDK